MAEQNPLHPLIPVFVSPQILAGELHDCPCREEQIPTGGSTGGSVHVSPQLVDEPPPVPVHAQLTSQAVICPSESSC